MGHWIWGRIRPGGFATAGTADDPGSGNVAVGETSRSGATGGSNGAGGSGGVDKPGISAQQEREITKSMRALERKMDKLEKSEAQIDEKMASAAEAVDTQRLTELNAEKTALAGRREELEAEWLELADQLDAG